MQSSTKIKLEFVEVNDPLALLSVLKERLPISCMMFNQVMQWKNFKEDIKFYSIGKEVNADTWIFSNNIREDYKWNYLISAPTEITNGQKPVPKEIKDCISSGNLISWDDLDNAAFLTLSVSLSNMLVDICANEKGNLIEVHPCVLYYMEREQALNLEIKHDDPNIEVRRLDASKNEEDFILKTWAYAIPGSEKVIPKCIAKNASGGVFINGQCVSGVYIPAVGFLSALYTLKEHRQKGYAKLTMNYTFKEFAKDGCIPCLTVERKNPRSIKFHEGLGLKVAAQVNGIIVRKLNVD